MIYQEKLSLLWLIVCCAGNVVQVYLLSSLYFGYDINTNIRLLQEEDVVVPTATICFDTLFLVKWGNLSREQLKRIFLGFENKMIGPTPILIDGIPNTKGMKLLSILDRLIILANFHRHLTVQELFNFTLDHEDFVVKEMITVFSPETNGFIRKPNLFDDYFNVSSYMRDALKCFGFHVKDRFAKHIFRSRIKIQPIASYVINTIIIKKELLQQANDISIMIGPRNSLSQAGMHAYNVYRMEPSRIHIISYDEYEEQLLPPPYITRCKNFSEPDENYRTFTSQDNCYEECVRRDSLRETGKIFPGLIFFKEDTQRVIPFFDMFSNISIATREKPTFLKDLYNQITGKCIKECSRKDCYTRTFIPKRTSRVRRANDDLFQLSFQIRQSPAIQAICLQQYTMSMFFADLISSFGFWLGLTAYGAVSCLKKVADSILQGLDLKPLQERKNGSTRILVKVSRQPWKRDSEGSFAINAHSHVDRLSKRK
jgi:hypothetical protein